MRWRGVPVLLHWSVLIALPWFYIVHRNLPDMALAFLSLFGLLLVHELGHAAVARWRKVAVDEIQLFIMHGQCLHEQPERKSDEIWIAWGGVAAQAILLVLAFGVSQLLEARNYSLYLFAYPVLRTLVEVNFILIVINLLPVPPLDGAKAWPVLPLVWTRLRRDRKLKRQSQEIAADIVAKLRKGK
jgi:Zn-dependent protease